MYRPLSRHQRKKGPLEAERVWNPEAGAFINIHAPARRQRRSQKGPKTGPTGMKHIFNIQAQAPTASSSGSTTPTDPTPDLFHTSHLYNLSEATAEPQPPYDSTRDSLDETQPIHVQEQDDDDFLPDIGDLRLTGVCLKLSNALALAAAHSSRFGSPEPTRR